LDADNIINIEASSVSGGGGGGGPAVDDAVELYRIVLPSLGHRAHVFVYPSQHRHVARPAFRGNARVTHAPRTFFDGFSNEKWSAGLALGIDFEETICAAAIGAEDHDALCRSRNVGDYGLHAVNNGRREVPESALMGNRYK
jgi:hypothetical protein